MIFKRLLGKKEEPEEIPLEENLDKFVNELDMFNNEDGEVNELMDCTEIYVKSVHPTSLEDISKIEKDLKKGNILIVHLLKLYEKPHECKRAIEQIRGICSFLGGDVGRISGGIDLIVTPSFIRIWRDE